MRVATMILIATCLATCMFAYGAETDSVYRLVVALRDGSRIVGTSKFPAVPLKTAYADVKLPLGMIRSIAVGEQAREVTITVVNGDKLTGVPGRDAFGLSTCFGDVDVKLQHVTTITVAALTDSVVESGLVLYFPFNGDARDASGNGNDGTVYGATLAANRFNQADSAYYFDGNGDYIEVPHSALFNINTNDFSLSIWLKYGPQPPPLLYSAVLNKVSNPSSPYEGLIFSIDIPRDACTFRIDGREELISQKNNWNNDTWRHFVCIKQSNQLTTYIDGTFDNSRTISRANVDNLAPIVFGANHIDRSSQNFKGVMDDIRIYNRALSEREVKELFIAQ